MKVQVNKTLILAVVFSIVFTLSVFGSGQKETEIFSTEKYVKYDAQAVESKKDAHILFFYANWCSWCRRMRKDLVEKIDTFPQNTTIYEVNFDNSNTLRQKYNITNKDTYVFLDPSKGTEIVKMGATLADLKNFFNSGNVDMTKNENPTGVGFYADYDPTVEKTFVGRKPYALFFHADWCPTCKKLDRELKKVLYTLPSSTAVFKVDYDTADTKLKQRYGVKDKHTIVFIDKNGKHVNTVLGFGITDIKNNFSK